MSEETAFLERLPAPSWQGFAGGYVKRFIAFAVEDAKRGRPSFLEDQIDVLTDEINTTMAGLNHLRSEVTYTESDIRAYGVEEHLTTEGITSQLEQLKTLPYVVGTLVSQETLRVILRLHVTNRRGTRDLGDVEIELNHNEGGSPALIWKSVRETRPLQGSRTGVRPWPYWDGYSSLGHASIVPYIEEVYAYLIEVNRRRRGFPPVEGEARETFWSRNGDAVTALKVYFDEHNHGPLGRRNAAVRRIAELKSSITSKTEKLRKMHRDLRALRSSLARAQAAASISDVIDVTLVERMLRGIIALPGVMGLRFNEEGYPVFHVRSSHLLDGERYDFGDYEVTFIVDGTYRIYATRGGSQHYYSHYTETESSFCFGDRYSDLDQKLREGEYLSFMNLLVNSLNGVNEGQRNTDDMYDYYDRIPVDLVWYAKMTRYRRKPASKVS